jgi:hypothetical protein
MNTTNTHTQLPEKLIVVDREWLEEGLKNVTIILANYEDNNLLRNGEYYRYKGKQSLFKSILSNYYPLTPILEDYFKKGASTMYDISYISGGIVPQVRYNSMSLDQHKQSYLIQPITLKKK